MTSAYVPRRTAEPVQPDGWQTGAAEFDDLTARCAARGWTIEHDARMPMYGAWWVVTPFGEFEGQGFGRADSLELAYRAALDARPKP